MVGKATPGRRGPRGPLMSWGPEKLVITLSSPGERERHNVDGHKSGGQNVAVMFGLQLPLTVEPHTTLSNLANKLRGTYFSREAFARLSSSLCCYDYEYTTFSYIILFKFLKLIFVLVFALCGLGVWSFNYY